jgi:hypothetical protein
MRNRNEKRKSNKIIKTIPLSIAVAALASGAAFAAVDEIHIDMGNGNVEKIVIADWSSKSADYKAQIKAKVKQMFLGRQDGISLKDSAKGKSLDLNKMDAITNLDDLFLLYGV